MKHLDTLKGPDFSGFDSFDSKGNPTLERASNTLRKLAQIIIDNKGSLNEPMIVGLHGMPGLGKSHLINAFEMAIKGTPGIKEHRPDKKYGFPQQQSLYKDANVIISDDLFQEAQNINEPFSSDFTKSYIARSLPEFLFDLYDGKKIWIVSSNFDIKEILKHVGEMDKQERLKSRINHLLASTGVLHLEGEDHRKVLAETGTRFSKLFE